MAQARGQAQYRASFALDVAGSLFGAVADLLGIVVMFRVTRTLGGFDFAASFLMATVASCGFAIADLAVGSVERLRTYVRTGLLDTVLIRPLGALWQVIAMDFAPRRVGRVLVTGVLVVVASARAGVVWTPARVVLALLAPLAAAVLFGAVFIASATMTFWWTDASEFANSMTYGGHEFTTYPATVFGGVLRGLLGYALGYAFAGYYPALVLLGRPDPLGLPAWTGWCSPLVAAVACCVAGAIWRIGIRHYRSTGS
jgi:viologen exporter family transport system permease protein